MINLKWSVKRKRRLLEVSVTSEGVSFLFRDTNVVHQVYPSEKILVKILSKKEAETFFKNAYYISNGKLIEGVFKNAWVNNRKTKRPLPYQLIGEDIVANGGKVWLMFMLEPKQKIWPGSASPFEFRWVEFNQVWQQVAEFYQVEILTCRP